MRLLNGTSCFVRVLVFCLWTLLIFAGGTISARDMTVTQVKTRVADLASKRKMDVRVKLKSGAVLRGYIVQPGPSDFIIVTRQIAQAYAYSDVVDIK